MTGKWAYLEVPQLGKLFFTVIKPASEGFRAFMDDFVRTNIASLGESLAAISARVWFFTSVSTFMSLEIIIMSLC